MGQQYTYSTRWKQNIVVVIHIYGVRAIFLLYYNHQDTESESQGIKISIAGPIFTQKNQRPSGTRIYILHKI